VKVLFENRYQPDSKIYKEYIFKVLYRNLYLIGGILTPVAIGMTFFSLWQQDTTFAVLFAVCGLILILSMLFACPMALRQLRKQYDHLHHGKQPESVFRFSDTIEISEGTLSVHISYDQITKIRDLKYSYVLMIGKYNAVILKKGAFTIGTLDELQAFLMERCPSLR
jgi:hypothetical protein